MGELADDWESDEDDVYGYEYSAAPSPAPAVPLESIVGSTAWLIARQQAAKAAADANTDPSSEKENAPVGGGDELGGLPPAAAARAAGAAAEPAIPPEPVKSAIPSSWRTTAAASKGPRLRSEDHLLSAAAMAKYQAQKIAAEMGCHGEAVTQTMSSMDGLGHLESEWIVPALLTDESLLAMTRKPGTYRPGSDCRSSHADTEWGQFAETNSVIGTKVDDFEDPQFGTEVPGFWNQTRPG